MTSYSIGKLRKTIIGGVLLTKLTCWGKLDVRTTGGISMEYLGLDETVLKEKGGYFAATEIERQPQLWKELVQQVKENTTKIESFFNDFDLNNTKIYLVGAGSSALAASIVENTLKKNLNLDVETVYSTKLILQPEVYFNIDQPILMVSFGSSGSTPESVEAVRLAQAMCKDLKQMFVLCVDNGILVNEYMNDKTLYIPLPKNTKGKSFAATAEFTCLILQALAIFDIKHIDDYIEFGHIAQEQAGDIFKNKMDMIQEIASLDTISMTTVGSLEFEHLAAETALKAVELTGGKFLSNFNSSIEYRHGPKLIMNSPVLCMHYLYPDMYVSNYDIDMMNEVATDRLKGIVVGIGFHTPKECDVQTKYYFQLKKEEVINNHPVLGVLLYALIMQSLIVHISLKHGVKADWPSTDDQVPKVANRVKIYTK
ncbi:MAG: SIS domain-containing protein [Anaerorhabdus sp.]